MSDNDDDLLDELEDAEEIHPSDDDQDESDRTEWAKSIGESIGAVPMWVLLKLGLLAIGVAKGILKWIPGRSKIYRGMIKNGTEQLYKQTGAAVIVLTIYGDGYLVPRPAEIDREEGVVRTNNDEEWTLSELSPLRLGDAPVVVGVADDHELASPIAARVAEAADLNFWDRVQPVRETSDGLEEVDYQSPQQVVADGGDDEMHQTFDDVLVDARNPLDRATGWIVSMRKGYELHWSQSSSEAMKKQEDRGRLSEMDPDQYRKQAIRTAALVLGGVALGLFGPALAAQVAGGAAGAATGGIGVSLWVQPDVLLGGGIL
ncbi:hypothetical protein SAMN06269185_1067 [Natronoarchaeum philippinense]|uniref:Uncharacterized protein n=1 Tax=Natronoarchaeum philippinense TaxID=558529 RepID=A0A285N9J1_NATPI|nr:hypothetical protein [Natronoarchaeum philippinense]SNZ06152.1 hypothetical protein SAMN06269185_1067 [Natronoarchaeum philippinense]